MPEKDWSRKKRLRREPKVSVVNLKEQKKLRKRLEKNAKNSNKPKVTVSKPPKSPSQVSKVSKVKSNVSSRSTSSKAKKTPQQALIESAYKLKAKKLEQKDLASVKPHSPGIRPSRRYVRKSVTKRANVKVIQDSSKQSASKRSSPPKPAQAPATVPQPSSPPPPPPPPPPTPFPPAQPSQNSRQQNLSLGSVKTKQTAPKTPAKPILKSVTSRSTGNQADDSVLNVARLIKDGRKSPQQFRMVMLAATSPSQLSVRTITEHYEIPSPNFATPDDVFRYRGYKKTNKIDEGAFGIVSKAIRLSDKLLVAVKEVDLRRRRIKRIEEMKRELFVLQKVNHENVVGLIEHFIVGQTLVIIMEFCAGGNLTSYLKETAIEEEEAKLLFKQMANSIKILHKKCIAHRDVKLNNFLLDSTRKVVKIADFGLSIVGYKQNDGIIMAKTYCGTEPYMAPELLRRNSLGVRSYNSLYADIWSLGICLFAMLTRTFPFKMHTSQQGLFKAQLMRKWRFPRKLKDTFSEELKDLVWHMLDPDADRRITIRGVMSHPWLNNNQLVVLSCDEPEVDPS